MGSSASLHNLLLQASSPSQGKTRPLQPIREVAETSDESNDNKVSLSRRVYLNRIKCPGATQDFFVGIYKT